MAFGRLQRSARPAPMSDINMTPLIDVMLVLLVIFMIAAPLMSSSLKLDLPSAQGAAASDAAPFLSVAIDPQGRLYVGDDAVALAELSARVADAARRNPATELQLRADKGVPYGRVAEVIGAVQKAGLSRVGLITEPVDAAAR